MAKYLKACYIFKIKISYIHMKNISMKTTRCEMPNKCSMRYREGNERALCCQQVITEYNIALVW